MAVTAYDASHLNSAQQSALQYYTDAWNNASDQAGKDAAHAAAEAIRNSAGYSSNANGSYKAAYNDVVNSIMPDYSAILNQVQSIVKENNATAQSNAQAQWDYNRAEAQASRDWTEYMSNTAHQREVADLKAAGLNPVLSATGGNGAAVTSGATASGSSATNDTSANSLLGSYLSSLINSATAINQANINAKSAANVANIETAMQYKLASDFPTAEKWLMNAFSGAINGLTGSNSAGEAAKGITSAAKDIVSDVVSSDSSELKGLDKIVYALKRVINAYKK